MKKILLVSTIPLSLKVFSLGLSFMNYLRDKGYEAAACAGPGPEAGTIRAAGFSFHEIYIPRTLDPVRDFQALRSLTTLMKEKKFDLVHTQTSKAGFLGRLAAERARIPLVIHTAHNWAFHPLLSSLTRNFYLHLEKKAAAWCDALIVDTRAVREYGLACGVAPADKIHQIYMGIDTNRFRPWDPERKNELRDRLGIGREKCVIGTIARMVPDKGIETVLACARAFKNNDDLVFVLCGDGELKSRFEQQARQQGISKKVVFAGHQDDVVPYLNIFDIFCLPTLREGFGVVCGEAQACAVPVVASDIGPLREVVADGKTGKLVPAGDAAGFAEALRGFFPLDVRSVFGKAARNHVLNNFSQESIHRQTLDLYQNCAEKKGI